MTYIPNVRERETTMFGRTRENAYWEGNLDEYGKERLAAYDAAIEDMGLWFDNMGCTNDVHVRDKKLEALREDFAGWCESQRNEFVVGMIEGQDGDGD